MNRNFKTMSGSMRDKYEATPKLDKWKDPFYCAARGKGKHRVSMSHKIDSIRESINGTNNIPQKGLFHKIKSAIVNFFRLNRPTKRIV